MVQSCVINAVAYTVQMNFADVILEAFNGAAYIFTAQDQVADVQAETAETVFYKRAQKGR